MALKKNDSEPLESFSEDQLANLEKSIKTLDHEDQLWKKEKIEDEARKRRLTNISIKRLIKSPLEIINRLLFFFFIGSFLFSFISVYSSSFWCFICYVFSAFSCILYTPNRKALKELIAAWPNIQDLIKNRSLWRK